MCVDQEIVGNEERRRKYAIGQILVITKSPMFFRLSGGFATPPMVVVTPRPMSRGM
jgi:hypothetical protein